MSPTSTFQRCAVVTPSPDDAQRSVRRVDPLVSTVAERTIQRRKPHPRFSTPQRAGYPLNMVLSGFNISQTASVGPFGGEQTLICFFKNSYIHDGSAKNVVGSVTNLETMSRAALTSGAGFFLSPKYLKRPDTRLMKRFHAVAP